MTLKVSKVRLRREEVLDIENLLSEIMKGRRRVDLGWLLRRSTVDAHELPRRVREVVFEFKMERLGHLLIVQGYPINETVIGATPTRHLGPGRRETADRYEILHILFASLLGEPFTWTTIQNGYLINDVMPVFDHRNIIASSGSDLLFDLHTEDAFHLCAGDYLGLMCLRNPNRAKTIFSSVEVTDLPVEVVSALFEPRFIVGANVAQDVPQITKGSPIFFGNRQYPYIRVNLNGTVPVPGDEGASRAFKQLKKVLTRKSRKVCFQSGDLVYIDNYRVVHGREPFPPKFDGRDRWLKRLYITSAFRNSARFRKAPFGRVLTP
jgi:L-asparagine oxygenase